MRFIDEATIRVEAGHGGPGCVSFRREKFIPRGGPDGGDGGKGGDVTFIATHNLSTLQDFRYKREYKAPSGEHGSGTNKAGRDGKDIEIFVPVGTVIRDAETDEVLCDMKSDGEKWVACQGGRGGKGNTHFVSSTHQAPKYAQDGEPGTSRALKLELKLLADAAIMGYPNAGKSTLISRLSRSRPKIADYPFTTLVPNLGVVSVSQTESYVIADIPGLIEGAHRGEGLGHRFLKHLERTRVLLHLIDGTVLLARGDDLKLTENERENAHEHLLARYKAIRNELGLFNPALLHKPEYVVINKADAVPEDTLESARKFLRAELNEIRGRPPEEGEPRVISAVSGQSIDLIIREVYRLIKEASTKAHQNQDQSTPLPDAPEIRRK